MEYTLKNIKTNKIYDIKIFREVSEAEITLRHRLAPGHWKIVSRENKNDEWKLLS